MATICYIVGHDLFQPNVNLDPSGYEVESMFRFISVLPENGAVTFHSLLVIRYTITLYSLGEIRSLLVAKFARYLLHKLLVAKNHCHSLKQSQVSKVR